MTSFLGNISGYGGKSFPPDWRKIGYSDTPQSLLDAFDYAKEIKENWTGVRTFTQDKKLYFFPSVDMTGTRSCNGLFQNSNLMHIEPITIGESTPTGNINADGIFQSTYIKKATISTLNSAQKVSLQNAFNNCALLESATINAKASSCSGMFLDCKKLTRVNGDFDTSEVTAFNEMFNGANSIALPPDIDTSSGTNFYRCFRACFALVSAPPWDLSNATSLEQMFWQDSALEYIPPYRIGKATNLTNMFQATGSNLSDISRNNILMMLATASSYTGTKTLARLGFTSSMYSAASWQALSHYSDFVDEGWSIGYN